MKIIQSFCFFVLFIALTNSHTMQAQFVSTLAGSGAVGFIDGLGVAARFSRPFSVAVDGAGNIYVGDAWNHCIRKITPVGVVVTSAGSDKAGFADGEGAAAKFDGPLGVAVDTYGNVYVVDNGNNRIRKVTPSGVVTTVAGSDKSGFVDGIGVMAQFDSPVGVGIDRIGSLYVADWGNNCIRKITPVGVVTTFAGSGKEGFADGAAATAQFYHPNSVAIDDGGNVYVSDVGNNRIRKITSTGIVTTVAGTGVAGFTPAGVALDGMGNLYVSDFDNDRIRKITSSGIVTTIAGTGVRGYADGEGASAQFFAPTGIVVDGAGNIYVADQGNRRIRKITLNASVPAPSLFPNPAESSCILEYTLRSTGQVRIDIVNLLGQIVSVINDGVQTVGTHTTSLNIGAIAAGVYHVRIISNDVVQNVQLRIFH